MITFDRYSYVKKTLPLSVTASVGISIPTHEYKYSFVCLTSTLSRYSRVEAIVVNPEVWDKYVYPGCDPGYYAFIGCLTRFWVAGQALGIDWVPGRGD